MAHILDEINIIRSRRRTISLKVDNDGEVVVCADPRVSMKFIEKFVLEKLSWIQKTRQKIENRKKNAIIINPHLVSQYKKQAHDIIQERLSYYSTITGLKFSKFRITSAKTRFGSCTSKGVLSFSWRLIFYPKEVIDYIVVHELTHLREFNHSRNFWERVELVLPEYKTHKKWLKEKGLVEVA